MRNGLRGMRWKGNEVCKESEDVWEGGVPVQALWKEWGGYKKIWPQLLQAVFQGYCPKYRLQKIFIGEKNET